ncbi:MAG TPA: RsmB/NOP family class I SAM-dependent RNA methyltransferase [Verrucomicrobiota bacterium]|nr:RNA methyltransferase [Verrucomicrobiales bacterium]HRI14120.1 RsmB/NOP family class I SAM-dependent RNA methyltransferase [Verrucomicrobiota bacterium]
MELAERVITKATPTIPADLLLRQTLARRKQLTRADSAWISRAVFSYFRWRRWLDEAQPMNAQLERALALADDFAISPANFLDAELMSNAVPSWTPEFVTVSPEWARSLQAEPALWLRARTGMAAQVSAQLGNCDSPKWSEFTEALRYDGQEDLFRHELFQAGAFEIQDLASQAVGLLCAPQPGETWWDACAGEGGKTLHLSDLMGGKGLVWASDRAEWRLHRLKQRAGRAGCFNYRSVLWKGGPKPATKTMFDGILLDAPCSGVGTWGRNPHARWTTNSQDVSELAVVQRDLLSNVAASLKVGGRLIYAVCTLTRPETTEIADAFSAAHPEFTPLPLVNPFAPGAPAAARLELWPQVTGANGMFIAAWTRQAIPDPAPVG